MIDLTRLQKCIYEYIVSFAKTYNALPNRNEIEKELGTNRNSVSSALRSLEEKGFLEFPVEGNTLIYSVKRLKFVEVEEN